MTRLLALLVATPVVSAMQGFDLTTDTSTACPHEYAEEMGPREQIFEGQTIAKGLRANEHDIFAANRTHRYYYENYNVTTINQPEEYRKLFIHLEPCSGVVYLFVRKTRPCWPNPYSCVNLETGARDPNSCEWTHFLSVIDGSRDGSPTLYEVPLTSTRWFISVFAATTASYHLTVLADIGAMPRPGGQGVISGSQKGELIVQLDWKEANFMPVGVSNVRKYWVFSSMLLESDERTNTQVFLRPTKVINTVCGLHLNTDREVHLVDPSSCDSGSGMCSVNVSGVMTQKRYIFNVVVESERGFESAYSGLILETNWQEFTKAASDSTLQVVGAICGTVLGLVVIGYLWLVKIYN